MISSLRKKVKRFPQTPGVYILKDRKGRPLYVGKASRLRNRLKTYVSNKYTGFNATRHRMVEQLADIEIRETPSEIEALVLESHLIKTLKPRYNVLMRDDKQYFYVGITNTPFPKLIITHQQKVQSSKFKVQSYLGPFVSGRSLKATLRALRKVFPYCTCKQLHKSERACLNYNLGLDLGYCCIKSSKLQSQIQNYKNNIKNIQRILKGQKAKVVKELAKEMKRAAKNQDFEKAARVRDQLENIHNVLAHKHVIERQDTPRVRGKEPLLREVKRIEGYDISNIQGQFAVGSMVVFERDADSILSVKKSDYRRFKIKTIRGANDPAMMKEVITRRLAHDEWPLPDIILVDGGKSQRNAALGALERVSTKNLPRVWGLAKQHEELYTDEGIIRLTDLGRSEAAVLAAIRDEAHRFAITYYRKVHGRALKE